MCGLVGGEVANTCAELENWKIRLAQVLLRRSYKLLRESSSLRIFCFRQRCRFACFDTIVFTITVSGAFIDC